MLERVVEYQITRNRTFPNVWHVEATDKEGKGEVYSVLFSGPYAKELVLKSMCDGKQSILTIPTPMDSTATASASPAWQLHF